MRSCRGSVDETTVSQPWGPLFESDGSEPVLPLGKGNFILIAYSLRKNIHTLFSSDNYCAAVCMVVSQLNCQINLLQKSSLLNPLLPPPPPIKIPSKWHWACSQRSESCSESCFGSQSTSWLELRAFTSIATTIRITNGICALWGNILFLLCWPMHGFSAHFQNAHAQIRFRKSFAFTKGQNQAFKGSGIMFRNSFRNVIHSFVNRPTIHKGKKMKTKLCWKQSYIDTGGPGIRMPQMRPSHWLQMVAFRSWLSLNWWPLCCCDGHKTHIIS